ncbi:MAG: hypothetical protein ACR2N5_06955 [Solirubrobacterales bacterium]
MEQHEPGHSENRHVRTPTSELPHAEKVARQRLHLRLLTGVLLVVLVLLAYSAAFDLNHWAEWVVFGGIVFAAIGMIIAVRPIR